MAPDAVDGDRTPRGNRVCHDLPPVDADDPVSNSEWDRVIRKRRPWGKPCRTARSHFMTKGIMHVPSFYDRIPEGSAEQALEEYLGFL